ncbi:MAG: sortase, partial [Eubacterium sp.]|nr:sortase [Eubacterium sp.]
MRKFNRACVVLGALLIISAIGLTGYNVWENYRAQYETDLLLQDVYDEIDTDREGTADYLIDPNMDMPTVEIDGYLYIGFVSIPKLELMLPVMDSWSYPQLKISPCRYAGSAYLNNMI